MKVQRDHFFQQPMLERLGAGAQRFFALGRGLGRFQFFDLAVGAADAFQLRDHATCMPSAIVIFVGLVDITHHFAHLKLTGAQPCAEREQGLDRHFGLEHDLEHATLAELDALAELNFALAREQRNLSHGFEIDAHRIDRRCCFDVGVYRRFGRSFPLGNFGFFDGRGGLRLQVASLNVCGSHPRK